MNDMTAVIEPRSDQINADDLIAGPMTIKVAEVRISPGTEQPVSIVFEGSSKFFRPCKSMSRVLVKVWGPDAKAYVGRSMTLYRDPKVKWGGMEVGGIRISHMTHLDEPIVMALTESKANRKPFTVKPLVAPANNDRAGAEKWVADHLGFVAGAADTERLDAVIQQGVKAMAKLSTTAPDLHASVDAAYATRRNELETNGPADDQRGEQFTGAADDLIARIEAADTDTLATIETDYQANGRAMFDVADQDRIETAVEARKAALS